MNSILLSLLVVLCLFSAGKAKKDLTCEVCNHVLKNAIATMNEGDKNNKDKIAEAIRSYCGGIRGKEQKFCFYIGALPESATSIMNDVTKPLSYPMPTEKVCQKLASMDAQICELKFDKAIDWNTVDLNKLRVKELKKILDDWGERCSGCTEKSEFVKMINDLKPKYVKSEL